MLKKRIIPVQLLCDGRLVKSRQFAAFRDVGDPVASSRVYNSQDADELVFINIARQRCGVDELCALLMRVAEVCFMPLTVGGGIETFADAAALVMAGADKVLLNSVAYRQPQLISRIAAHFGRQAVIVAVDARRETDGSGKTQYVLYAQDGTQPQSVSLEQHLQSVTAAGAGELFIQSIDCDGAMCGYDLSLLQRARQATTLPIIACGGAGNYEHLKDAFLTTGVGAVACGSLFNFSDSNPIRAKAFLSNYNIPFKRI